MKVPLTWSLLRRHVNFREGISILSGSSKKTHPNKNCFSKIWGMLTFMTLGLSQKSRHSKRVEWHWFVSKRWKLHGSCFKVVFPILPRNLGGKWYNFKEGRVDILVAACHNGSLDKKDAVVMKWWCDDHRRVSKGEPFKDNKFWAFWGLSKFISPYFTKIIACVCGFCQVASWHAVISSCQNQHLMFPAGVLPQVAKTCPGRNPFAPEKPPPVSFQRSNAWCFHRSALDPLLLRGSQWDLWVEWGECCPPTRWGRSFGASSSQEHWKHQKLRRKHRWHRCGKRGRGIWRSMGSL